MKYFRFFLIILFMSIFQISNAIENNLDIKITKNLRCLICQGQSVYDSDSEFANSIKILVSQKLKEGFSEKEIYIFLKDKYGEWILYKPEFNKNTYFLWLLPIFMFLLGGAIIFKLFNIRKIPLKSKSTYEAFIFTEKKCKRKIVKSEVDKFHVPYDKMKSLRNGADWINGKGEVIPNEKLTIKNSKPHTYAFCSDTRYDAELVSKIKKLTYYIMRLLLKRI